MKKHYLFVVFLCIVNYSFGQLTVSAVASTPTICAGSSTAVTASASPVSYTMAAIAYNPIPSPATNILCQNGVVLIPLSFGNLDDGRWDNITLPFTVRFYDVTYNSIHISTNGWIGMGNTNTTSTGMGFTLANVAAPNNVIHAITADLNFKSPTTSSIEYFEDGFAPNRKFVIGYNNISFFSGGGTANVQVILNEGTNVVEIHTTDCTNTTLGKAQGVENSTGTNATVVAGRNNSTTWAGTPNAYKFTPDQINYSWSPATGLSATTGGLVTASPSATTTYTITATNASNAQTGSTNVTVTISGASYVLAATAGGPYVCQNISVAAGGTDYRDGNCNLIASIVPAGVSPVTNSINTCLKIDAQVTKRGTTDLFVARKYDIEPLINPATSTANIKLYFLQTEFNDFNLKAADSGHTLLPTGPGDATGISNLILRQYHGTGTAPGNYTGAIQNFTTVTSGFTVVWNSTRSWWEVTVPVTGFSGFYITSKKAAVLPIGLEYFRGTQNDKKNLLNWKISCTSQVKFELQRSNDGQHFLNIAVITADRINCGQPFDYTDEHPLSRVNYYRLKMIDADSKSAYSNIVSLMVKSKGFEMISINPNIISKENAMLTINAGEKTDLILVVSDFSGRIVSKQNVQIQPGMNQIRINTANLSVGTYQLSGMTAKEPPKTLRFIKQ